ncbi:MAG: PEP-CTERM sorting domain-containing protein, partial [Pirellulales bacterium]
PDPGNCCGETQSGLEFQKDTGSGALQLQVRGGAFSISDLVQTGSLNYYTGGIYDFRIMDTGDSVTFQMTEVGNPANTAMLTANITGDTNTDFVTFHNREGNHTARLDNLRISSLNSTLGVDNDGFQVRQVQASGLTIDSFADAEALLALNPGDVGYGSEANEARSLINYVDGGGNGNYGGDNPFPLGGDDFALLATATLQSPTDETWTFAINIDDGARLRIGGVDVISEDRIGGTADFFGTIALSQGLHDLELLFFEQGGGAAVELFYARGTHTTFDPEAFTLLTIGATIVPEPQAWAIGLLGAVFIGGVCWRRRRAQSAITQGRASQVGPCCERRK